jgi:hypothetical protein
MSEETSQEIQEKIQEEIPEKIQEEIPEVQERPKKRGRPQGAKNKPKIIETPLISEPAEPVVMKSSQEPRMFTREEVQSLLLDSCRLQEQRLREEKRERYSAFFRRQKWTQS